MLNRTASYKSLTIFGLAASSTCYLLLLLTWRGHTNLLESFYIAPGGFGTGVVMSTTFVCLAAGVEESQMAIASTGLYLSVNIGTLMGTSLASSVLQTSLRKGLNQGLKDFPDQENVSYLGSCITSRFAFWSCEVTNIVDADHSTNAVRPRIR